MHDILRDLVLVFGVSSVVVFIFSHLKQPPIPGYLLSGVLLGSSGFSIITDATQINNLAELGLVFLLFSIGIEFSIKKLARIRKAFFIGGGLQVFVTAFLFAFAYIGVSDGGTLSFSKALLTGILISLSSTAIVLKVINERRELNTPQGGLALAILLFQDLVVIPVILLIPYLANPDFQVLHFSPTIVLKGLAIGVAVVGTIMVGARYVAPFMLDYVAKTQVRELFLISIALMTFGFAYLGEKLGVSMAMGAFIAGLMISESRYGHQVVSDLVPLRDPFVAVFFVSIGLLLDVQYFRENYLLIGGAALAAFVFKYLVAATVASVLKYESRIAATFAIYISQIGEFSFVIAGLALSAKILSPSEYQLFLSVSLVTMIISPSLIRFAPKISPGLGNFDFYKKLIKPSQIVSAEGDGTQKVKTEHVVIIGYGLNGQNLARALRSQGAPYSVIEMGFRSYELAVAEKEPVFFGSGSSSEVLEAADIKTARMVVVGINDTQWIAKIVNAIRLLNPHVFLIVRCPYVADAKLLRKLPIDELIVGEELTAEEILKAVFTGYGFQIDEAENLAELGVRVTEST